MYGLTGTSHSNTVSPAIGAEAIIQLHPQLLRRGEEWIIEAVVSGTPAPELDSPLIDTDIVSEPAYAAEIARGFLSAFAAGLRSASGI